MFGGGGGVHMTGVWGARGGAHDRCLGVGGAHDRCLGVGVHMTGVHMTGVWGWGCT